jgi:lipoprotein-anchoring transpeptidase ErfK/SrfK
MQLLTHYQLPGQKVVIISLHEQALRVYENGQLVKAFLVTTGGPVHPSLPGVWWVEAKLSPTVFKAGVPVGSPDYYPDTKINYAMQYHSRGYFLHDSWWRINYGPGTNFPHQDSTGNAFASSGSHGCVNLSTADAAWLYQFVNLNTKIIIY